MKIFLKSIEVSKVVREKDEEEDEEEIDTSVRVQQINDDRSHLQVHHARPLRTQPAQLQDYPLYEIPHDLRENHCGRYLFLP